MKNITNDTEFDERSNHLVDGRINGETNTIPVLEEQISVDKKVVDTGRVRISKIIKNDEETVKIPLNLDKVDVQRIEVNKYVDETPAAVRYEGETMIIPVLKEVLVVEKRLMLVEEIHVTHKKVQEVETQTVALRKEEVIVQHDDISDRARSEGNS